MRIIYVFILAMVIMSSCQNQNFIETGLYDESVDKTMLEYMRGDSYNWDSTVLIIERAKLEDLFTGNDDEYPEITFLGCTNLSILRYMFENDIEKVADIPEETCREMILDHVFEGNLPKGDVPFGIGTPASGGKDYTTIGGSVVRLYRYTTPGNGVSGAGPTFLYLESYDYGKLWDIASADIRTNTGIVHSMHYHYIFGEL